MKTSLLGLVLLASACGATDSIFWEKCDGPPCHTDATSRWDIYANGGDVNGSHDFLGPADPYVCLTIAGNTECSSSLSDNDHPRWNDRLFSNLPASSFLGKPLAVRYMDQDTDTALDKNDTLCTDTVTIGEGELANGGVEFRCEAGSAAFTFHFVR